MWRNSKEYISILLESCINTKTHKAGKLLHAHLLRTGLLSSHTFLSNRLIDFYFKCGNINYARNLFDVMPERNIFSWNTMLSSLCAANKLHDARILFDEMPERNVVSWNNMISALVRNGDHAEALDLYTLLIFENLVPTHFTLASILRACSVLLEVEFGRRCHCLAVKAGIDKNLYVGNALLSMYAKCGSMGDAIRVFAELSEPNAVSFTALMCGLVETQRVEKALETFKLMHRAAVGIDPVSLSSILGVCAEGHGRLVHGLSVRLGFQDDFHLNNSLLDMYAKNGDMDSAEILFQNMPELNVVSWNIMIAGYGQTRKCDKAVELMERMEIVGYHPDEVTFINVLAACVRSGNVVVGRRVFDKMPSPRLSSWNAMLSGYSQIGKHDEVIILFRQMQCSNLKSDKTTLAVVLGSCAEMGLLEFGKQVHAVSLRANVNSDIYVGSGLITLYSRSGKMDSAKSIFDGLHELDIVCWNSIIAGFSLSSIGKEAFDYFNIMRRRDMSPTQISYAIILSCCTKLSFSSQGRQIHAQIVKDGCIDDVFVGSALIDMYCKCGNVEGARCIFDAMPAKNVVVWNEMIHGYAQNGSGHEAVRLYDSMITAGHKPDGVTFISMLTACSHSGLVDEGIRIFVSMQLEHEVKPLLDHYTCIIDCLGRAGRLHEAEMLIKRMPCQNDPVVWEVLLSSCRVYSDALIAERAAEKLVSLDPTCSTPYVLLGNIYSDMGRWEEARAVRELMSGKNVGKGAGYSWIENNSNGSEASEVHYCHFSQPQWG